MNNSLREKRHQQEEDGTGKQIALQKLVSFSVCLCSVTIIEDSYCNGLADDVFPSPVSSGPHCAKTKIVAGKSDFRSFLVYFFYLLRSR